MPLGTLAVECGAALNETTMLDQLSVSAPEVVTVQDDPGRQTCTFDFALLPFWGFDGCSSFRDLKPLRLVGCLSTSSAH